MDIVPVIMEVEDRFGVKFPNERGWPVTVGDLYLAILGKLSPGGDAPCPTSRTFYRLRRTLTEQFAVDRRRARPAARLCDLFPAATRAQAWPRLRAALGLPDLPELPRRRRPSARAFRLVFAGVTAGWWLLYPILSLVRGDPFSLTFGVIIWLLLGVVVGEWFFIFWFCGLVRYLEQVRIARVAHLVARLSVEQAEQSESSAPAPRAVWDALVALIAAQAGLLAKEVFAEQRIGDLPDYC